MKRKMTIFAVLLTSSIGLAKLWASSEKDLIENRVWIDKIPSEARDLVHGRVFFEEPGFYYEIEQSAFRNYVDLCSYKPHHGHFDVECQHLEDMKLTLEAYECDDAPEPFEYCLEVTEGDGRTKTFYSMEGMEIDSIEESASLFSL